MKYTNQDHTFVLCAYKESDYLEDCLKSLLNQTIKSNIIVSTSTPNEKIDNLCKEYDLKLYVNDGRKSIADDWNYGYSKADTKLVTIAHQDDIYDEKYLENILKSLNDAKKPLIAFSDYYEIRNGEKVYNNSILKIKRTLLTPVRFKSLCKVKLFKRMVLAFGNGICCPAVTLVKENINGLPFIFGYKSNVDWQAWEILSKQKGEFMYVKSALMGHRIHSESETSRVIGDSARSSEDYEMFCKFWIKPIAKMLTKFYANSEKSNQV